VATYPHRWFCIAVIAAVIGFCAASAHAGLSGYRTRSIPSANGKYLLVLLAPEKGYYVDGPVTEDELNAREKTQQIEDHYSQSGLYRNDGSTELLWPIEYLSVLKDIFVSDDGVHLIVLFPNWECDTCSDRGDALAFYAHGQQLSRYREDILLAGYWGRCLLSCYAGAPWTTCTSAKFDDKKREFEIATNWGDMFRFDITTGKVIDSITSSSVKTTFFVTVVLIGSSVWWVMRRLVRVDTSRDINVAAIDLSKRTLFLRAKISSVHSYKNMLCR
jgi:hypothetical protein